MEFIFSKNVLLTYTGRLLLCFGLTISVMQYDTGCASGMQTTLTYASSRFSWPQKICTALSAIKYYSENVHCLDSLDIMIKLERFSEIYAFTLQ